jgi:ribosomal protein S27E
MANSFKFKKDKYKRARGGHSRLLNVSCRKCGNLVLIYQKDGPGNLRRLYLDRIFFPKPLADQQNKPLNQIYSLKCKICGEILGTPYIYPKEKRKAFRLYTDAVIKKIRKLKER